MDLVIYIVATVVYFVMRMIAISRVESKIDESIIADFKRSPYSHLNLLDIVVGFIPYINAFFAFVFLFLNTNHVEKTLEKFHEWCRRNSVVYKIKE